MLGELAVLPGRLRMGPRLDVRTELVDDVEPGGILDSGAVTGVGRFTALGVGLSATWDTRDTPLWATRGTFAQGWFLGYPSTIGGGHEQFARLGGEVRGFLPLPHQIVLGGAAYFEEAHGEAPFALLPKLGSTRWLRGYREGRFRDRLAWAAQTEVRVPVRGRLAATGFLAAGDVAPSLGELRWDTIKVAGGGGLRWRLSNSGAHVRADAAAGGEGVEFYVTLLEAF
jgi:outer membrane protein assembly factor BamA